MAGDDERTGPLVRRSTAADQDLALGVLAGADRLDLVLGQRRVPAEDGLEGVVDRAEQRVDRAVAGRLGASVPRPPIDSVTEPVAFPPCDEVTLQPTIATDAGTSDERCSTRAWRSASVTSFLASARATACR